MLLRQARDVPRGGLRHGNRGHLGLRHKARQESWLKHRTCMSLFRKSYAHEVFTAVLVVPGSVVVREFDD